MMPAPNFRETNPEARADPFTMKERFPRRQPVSFRLRTEALLALQQLCKSLGLSKTRAVEMLLLEQISPARLGATDLERRRPSSQIEEIRHLVQLARALGSASFGTHGEATLVLAEIHQVIRAIGQSLHARRRKGEPFVSIGSPARATMREDLP